MEKHIYKPLPKHLTIKESPIHGLGLFSVGLITKGTFLGVSHVHSSFVPSDIIDITYAHEEYHIDKIVEGNHLLTTRQVFDEDHDKVLLRKDMIFPNGMIRTPLGGFINHSEDDNCDFVYLNSGLWGIVAREDIQANTELTLNYSLTPCGVIKPNTD
jgi:SET domain-containing protein